MSLIWDDIQTVLKFKHNRNQFKSKYKTCTKRSYARLCNENFFYSLKVSYHRSLSSSGVKKIELRIIQFVVIY